MTTELTTYNHQMPTLPSDAPMGYDQADMDLSRMPIPRWRLVQSLSQAFKDGKAKVGQLENSLTGDVINAGEEFIFIKYSKGAALFEDRGGGLICKSNDGKLSVRGDSCEKCPHDAYYKTWGEDGTPPRCAGTINLLGVRRSTLLSDMPDVGIVTFSKISFQAGMKLLSTAVVKQKPLYIWSYKLNAEPQAKFNGAYAYKPASTGFVTNDELETLVAIAKRFSDFVVETEMTADEHDTEETPKGGKFDAF